MRAVTDQYLGQTENAGAADVADKFQSLVRFRKTDIDAWLDQRTALGRTAAGRMTTAKKISEEILEDFQNRPRRGRAPRAKS